MEKLIKILSDKPLKLQTIISTFKKEQELLLEQNPKNSYDTYITVTKDMTRLAIWYPNEDFTEIKKMLCFNGNRIKINCVLKGDKYHIVSFDKNGSKKFEGSYDLNCKQDGMFTKYYDGSDQIRVHGYAVDKKYNGYGTMYHKDGTVEYRGLFHNNKVSGCGKRFYPSGNPDVEGVFKDGEMFTGWFNHNIFSKGW